MPHAKAYVFVLWAHQFEEATATIFVSELRRAGLRVKVVGLTQRRSAGVCGLALLPDLTLEQALPLASHTLCLVIPCTSPAAKRLKNDPRLADFFGQAHANQAKFVIGPLDEVDLNLFPPAIDKITIYPGSEDLIEVARGLARSLSN